LCNKASGRNKRAIEDRFDTNMELENILNARGKLREADLVWNILPNGMECNFICQPEQLGLGHAVPFAERVIRREPFAVWLADDFFADCSPGVISELVTDIEISENSQISVMQVDKANVSKYEIVTGDIESRNVEGLVEKPRVDSAPSNYASLGRYVLIPEVFDELKSLSPGSVGEIQLSDTINSLAKKFGFGMVPLDEKRFDCWSVEDYKDAILNRIYESMGESDA
jgi:UTP--glucose-1-phosphate uridylyltransferase